MSALYRDWIQHSRAACLMKKQLRASERFAQPSGHTDIDRCLFWQSNEAPRPASPTREI
jgi:hypothetical protein